MIKKALTKAAYAVSYTACFILMRIDLFALIAAAGSTFFLNKENSNQRLHKGVIAGALGIIFLVNFSPIPKLLMYNLEKQYPRLTAEDLAIKEFGKPGDMLVLLGGSFDLFETQNRTQDEVIIHNPAASRTYDFIALMEKFKKAQIIFTGTDLEMAKFEQIVTDFYKNREKPKVKYVQARTTIENALNTLKSENKVERIVLVTSAFHMPRSYQLFKHNAQNIEIIPYPIDFHVAGNFNIKTLIYNSFCEPQNRIAWQSAIKEGASILNNKLIGYK
ncbi:YdcF family protein [Rickettsiales endosymbiont of Stachyamoeba lipophora]|uniref:YdcF family protein n=1 Tax=Rickettsiales endosymbiont of Stachyamoeba lipophora TaxID=2486578 RepID=UPI000F647BD5|nr:YdcF family protein [Rickettsiales endosymbiont of Stachyamoeba lipophora]AZL16149.1 YdcF family protein [Rickettsiales endosymbiont of Stachyamoeba lipophora]